jgi:hypothetical protein
MESADRLPSEPSELSEMRVETLTRPIRRRPKVAPSVADILPEAIAPPVIINPNSVAESLPIRRRPKVAPPVTKNHNRIAESQPTNEDIALAIAVEEAKSVSLVEPDDMPCSVLYDPCTKNILEKIDPLSGNNNYDIKLLEKRLKEIKKLRDTASVGLYNLNNKTTNYEFLMNVFCDKKIALDDMVSFRLQEGGQIGSDIYEVLCRLFVIFGGVENINVLNGDFKIMLKIEDPTSMFNDVKTALENMKCKATSKMGVSDITLIKTKTTKDDVKLDSPYCEIDCEMPEPNEIKTHLMSVKWYQKEKNAEHYDLEKLYIAGDKLVSEEKMPYGLIVFLKSRAEYAKAHSRASRQYTNDLAKTFFGWNEDVRPFLEDIRRTLFQNADILQKTPQELMLSQYFTPLAKPILSLLLHQDIIVTGINNLLESNPYNDNRYTIGVLPRGGKTFIAGGIIREYINRNKIKNSTNINILWITAAPNETRSQVGDELILKYQDFDSFNFVDVKNLTDFSGKRPKSNTVWFCSIQLLTATHNKRAKERKFLTTLLEGSDINNKINMIFFDEAHAGGAGFENKKVIDKLIEDYSNNIPFIFLTATYLGIVFEYNIIKPNLFVWDYTDILKTRAITTESERDNALSNLKLRFGDDLVNTIINKRLANTDSYEAMGKPYLDFPELYFISSDFNEEAKERFTKQDLYNPNKGFSFEAIFGLKSDYKSFKVKTPDGKIRKDAYKVFNNLEHPRNLISLLTPSDPTHTFNFEAPGGDPLTVDDIYEQTLLKRIERISYKTGSRFRIDEYPTLLMFLPTGGEGTDIYKLLPAFASLLMSHQWWNARYEVACVISDNDKNSSDNEDAAGNAEGMTPANNIRILDKNIKPSILSYERDLQCRADRKGLIILAGERLSMGISLPCTDCVFLFNKTKSPDSIIQKMYRALTPSINKKSSFIVDLNPLRSLSAVYGYTRAAYESAVTKSNIIDIIYDIYSWDEDIINLQLEKGGSKRITSSQERLSDMLEKASKEKEFKAIYKNIGDFEKQLKINIAKKVEELGLMPILKDIVIGKLQTKNGARYTDTANVLLKSGKVVVRIQKENSSEEEKEDNKQNKEVEDIVIIDNFTEAISDFIKYLATTSQEDNLDDAITEFESNNINNSGKSLKMDIVELLKARGYIKPYVFSPSFKNRIAANPIDNNTIVSIFIDVIKNYSPASSREIFRQMRGKIDEPSIRKNEILKIIHRHLTPKQSQKQQFGEVFTPIKLVEKITSHLPKSIWSNPDMKWLDPANGIGNFPITVFYKLDEGLKEWQPNAKKRRKHIIENMLYMIELQSNNNRIAKRIFKSLCGGCKPNIITANSVEITPATLKAKGFPENYDVVMGNPPFQNGRNKSFYVYFIDLANKLLKDGGYLVYVIPNKILIPNKANDSIKNFNPLYIYHTVNSDFLPTVISTTICAIICKKEPFDKKVTVKFENGIMEVNLEKPTPTQYNDINLKKVSDKILFGKDRKYLTTYKDKPSAPHLYISRVWIRYSPDKPKGGSHIFNISDSPHSSDDGSGRYVTIPSGISKSDLIWFLTRSNAMRFITKIYAGAMNVPAFIWDIIPYVNLTKESDTSVYKLLDLNSTDISVIEETLNDTNKPTSIENESEMNGGYRRFNKTRKNRNFNDE